MPLLEKVRVEVFIPDLPDPVYARLLDELGDELSYTFGGCSMVSAAGKYRSNSGAILPDQITILFSDIPLAWEFDQQAVQEYTTRLQTAVVAPYPMRKQFSFASFP